MKLIRHWSVWNSQWTKGQVAFFVGWTLLWLAGAAYLRHSYVEQRDFAIQEYRVIMAHSWNGGAK